MMRTVLIIDDEEGIARALAIRLRAAGFQATTAASGMLGLAAASAAPPDLIILDVRMPDIDGFEVHARLRRDPKLASIPVIFLSASVQDSTRHAALAAGAFAYLTKPYDSREIVTTVTNAISGVPKSTSATEESSHSAYARTATFPVTPQELIPDRVRRNSHGSAA